MDIVPLIGLGIVLFASTNVDDIFVLLGFFSDRRFRVREVAVGQYVGIGALVAVSVVGSLVSLVLAPAYVGLLGLLPVLIGLKKLWELRGYENAAGENDEVSNRPGGGALSRMAQWLR